MKFVDELLKEKRINIGVLLKTKGGDDDVIQDFVNEYDKPGGNGEGYYVMSSDTMKIDSYRNAIKAILAKKKSNWLEIGPGSDAVLSRIVMDNSDDKKLKLTMIEGNSEAFKKVKSIMGKNYFNRLWKLYSGLSTSGTVREKVMKHWNGERVEVVVSELLGMIMSGEHAVDIMEDVQRNYVKGGGEVVMIPRWGATFFTPMNISKQHLKKSLKAGLGVCLSPDLNWLHSSRVDIKSGSVFSMQSGLLEYIDFKYAMREQKYQQRVHRFKNDGLSEIIVNSLGLWIWCGFDDGGRKFSKTSYPYDYDKQEGDVDRYLVDRDKVKVDMSSLLGDEVSCTNWRNIVMLFNDEITVPVGWQLEVISECDLRKEGKPKYRFMARMRDEKMNYAKNEYKSEMNELYNKYWFSKVKSQTRNSKKVKTKQSKTKRSRKEKRSL